METEGQQGRSEREQEEVWREREKRRSAILKVMSSRSKSKEEELRIQRGKGGSELGDEQRKGEEIMERGKVAERERGEEGRGGGEEAFFPHLRQR
jgi:hypothetical protein